LTDRARTPQFLYAAVFLTVHIFRQGVMLAGVGPQAELRFPDAAEEGTGGGGGADEAIEAIEAAARTTTTTTVGERLAYDFSFILPLGFLPMLLLTLLGVSGTLARYPLSGYAVVNVLSSLYNLLLLTTSPPAWIASFALFPLVRQLVFSTFFSHLAGEFGHGTFGRLSGVASTCAGAVQLAQIPLLKALEGRGSRRCWDAANLILGLCPMALAVPVVPVLFPGAFGRGGRAQHDSEERRRLVNEEEWARAMEEVEAELKEEEEEEEEKKRRTVVIQNREGSRGGGEYGALASSSL